MTSPPNPHGWRGCSARPRRGATVPLTTLGGWRNPLLGVCTADRPVGCDTHCREAASATLSIKLLLSLAEAWAAGHSLLGVCTADRPVGCDARRRRCVGNALDQRCCSRSRKLQASRRSACAPLIAVSGVTLAAAAASATLSINAAALALGTLGGTGRSLLGVSTADRPVGCDARRRSCVGNTFDPRCCSRSRKLGRHRPLAARCLHR
jgi:hypothetical protein